MESFTYTIEKDCWGTTKNVPISQHNYLRATFKGSPYENYYYINVHNNTGEIVDQIKILFSTSILPWPNISNIIRYHKDNTILFISFYNIDDWALTYYHFRKFYNQFQHIRTQRQPVKFEGEYFHEVFQLKYYYTNRDISMDYKPTKMFLDLDFKDDCPDVYPIINDIVSKIYKIIGWTNKKLEYVITRNNLETSKSRHVIFTNLILPSIKQCRILAKKINNVYVDVGPYANNRSLRILYSHKDENKYKIIDRYVNINYNYNPKNIEDMMEIKYSTLIQENNLIPTFTFDNEESQDSSDSYEIIEDVDLKGVDLQKYNCDPVSRNGNIINLYHKVIEECPLCNRIHNKRTHLYLAISKSGISLKCFQRNNNSDAEGVDGLGPERIILKKKNIKMLEWFKEIKPLNFNKIKDILGEYYETYNNPYAKMPENVKSNCLYLVSPCKSGKTKLIHDFIEKLEPEKSAIFITTQRIFSQELHNKYKDLGFQLYTDEEFNNKHNRIIISLYSLHRIPDNIYYDYLIIDEIETLILNLKDIKSLGLEAHKKSNLNKFIKLIHDTQNIILMDAYPSIYTINIFKHAHRNIHMYHNTYKTHKDDRIVLCEYEDMAPKIADSIINNKKIVFASALLKEQKRILEKAFILLLDYYSQKGYKFDFENFDDRYYSSECDREIMHESILTLSISWQCDLLAYSPVITAGISFEEVHFDHLFYLGAKCSSHISTLQALYRCRDLKDKTYYIAFSSRTRQQQFNINTIDKEFEYFLNFNTCTDNGYYIKLDNNFNNYLIKSSLLYYSNSQINYYRYLISQLKYNESEIIFGIDYDDYNSCIATYKGTVSTYEGQDFTEEKKYLSKLSVKYEVKKMNIINERLEPYINAYTPEGDDDFKKLDYETFEKLRYKENKSSQEDEIFRINLYYRMFPLFTNEKYQIIKDNHATFSRYHNTYINDYKYIYEYSYSGINKKYNKPLENINYDLNDDIQIRRFKIIIAYKLMYNLIGHLLNEDYEEINDNEYVRKKYMYIHNFDFTGYSCAMGELSDSFDNLVNELSNNDNTQALILWDKIKSVFLNTKSKKMNARSYPTLLNNIVDGAFNLNVKTFRKQISGKKYTIIQFNRNIELF